MTPELRAELFKQRSTRTNLALLGTMLALVLAAVLLHGASLPSGNLDLGSDQLEVVFGWGEVLAALFAALVGAMSVTAEFRYGTIRPTLLVSPRRGRIVAAKLASSAFVGTAFGVLGALVAAAAGSLILAIRGIDIRLDAGDYATLVAGGAAAAALWAAIGVGVGAVVRNQVSVLVGLCAWLLFVERVLIGDADLVGDIGRYTPGSLGSAASGQEPLLAPAIAAVLLLIYACVVAAAGWFSTTRRDVA
jgi:ABC-2 type transport system permease protein